MYEFAKNLFLIILNVVVTILVLGGLLFVVISYEVQVSDSIEMGSADYDSVAMMIYPYYQQIVAFITYLIVGVQVLRVSYKHIYKPLKPRFMKK